MRCAAARRVIYSLACFMAWQGGAVQVRGSCMVTGREKGAFLSFVGKRGREGAFFPFALAAERKKSKFLSKANNAGMDKVSGQSCCHF